MGNTLENQVKTIVALHFGISPSKVRLDDRFLIADNTVWHIGASLKDAGSALFAMMKMEIDPAVILGLLL